MSDDDHISVLSIIAGVLVAGDIAADHSNQRQCRYFKRVDGESGVLDADKAVNDAEAILDSVKKRVKND